MAPFLLGANWYVEPLGYGDLIEGIQKLKESCNKFLWGKKIMTKNLDKNFHDEKFSWWKICVKSFVKKSFWQIKIMTNNFMTKSFHNKNFMTKKWRQSFITKTTWQNFSWQKFHNIFMKLKKNITHKPTYAKVVGISMAPTAPLGVTC